MNRSLMRAGLHSSNPFANPSSMPSNLKNQTDTKLSSFCTGLRSSDPFANPAIDLNYYSDAEGADLQTLREGIRLAREVFAQEPLAQHIREVSVVLCLCMFVICVRAFVWR